MKIEATPFEVAELISILQGREVPGNESPAPMETRSLRLLNGGAAGSPLEKPVIEGEEVTFTETSTPDDLEQRVKNVIYNEMHHVLSDIEFRVKQAYDVERRAQEGHRVSGKVYAEDMNVQRHALTGYTVTANSPSAGSIAWASLHVVYNGTDYTMTDGNTALKYVWFDPAATNGTTALQTSNTKPDLTAKPDAALLFVNNGGTPVDVIKSTMPIALANGAVDSSAIIAGAVGSSAIASGAVGSSALASGAVTSTAIAANAVTANAIASGAVGSTELASGAVTSTAIASGAVGSTQLATNAVGTSNIQSGAVGSTQIANNAVTATQLANGAVGTSQLASGAVTATNIASGAVGSAQLTSGSVTAAKLNTLQHLLY